MRRKILSCVFLALLFLQSCNATDKPVDSVGTTVTGSEATTTQAPTEPSIFDSLPVRDFEGDEFTFYVPPNPFSPVDKGLTATEEMGEVFNDVVYNRNREVEEQYNIKIKTVYGDNWSSAYGDIKKSVKSDEHIYDVVLTHVINSNAAIVTEGYALDWANIPYVDFSKPWWNQSIIANLNAAKKIYYTASSLTVQEPLVLLYNKDMGKAYGIENPYDLVRTGKWTMDKLAELAKSATKDLNGDGEMTVDDQYGLEFGIHWQLPSLLYASAETSVKIEDGVPVIQLGKESFVDIYDKIYSLIWDDKQTYAYDGKVEQTANVPHIGIDSGRVMFCQWNLFSCETLRNSTVDYGILPLPKLSEEQVNYMTNSWTGMYCIPSNTPDTEYEKIGIIMEAMSAKGYDEVIPVYYNSVLKQKVSRDTDSEEMLDIILNNMVFDFGLNMATTISAGNFMGDMIRAKKESYVSEYAKVEERMAKSYQKTYDTILAIAG
jgi:hypothetical protein